MKKVLAIVLFLTVKSLFAQDYKFGKVSVDELKEKYNPKDSSAVATYLYKNRKTYFKYIQGEGFGLVTEIHERVKIYNKEGFDYANKEVSLYKNSRNKELVKGLKAYTYNLENGKIKESKLKSDGVFKSERSRNFNEVKFTMPNIKPGAIVEYKYAIHSPFYFYVDQFNFQEGVPVRKLDFKFEYPEYFVFKPNIKGYLAVNPINEKKNGKYTFNNKVRRGDMKQVAHISTSVNTSTLDYIKNIVSYKMEDVPALKEEAYVSNIDNYRTAVKYELERTRFPNSKPKDYSTSWEDVAQAIFDNEDFGNELKKENYFKKDVDALISNVSNPAEKLNLIFGYVKAKMKWNDYSGKYVNQGVKKAYKDKVGNVAEINLMLVSMLRYAGLKANPVLISTRDHGVPLFPTREGFNYVICAVELDENVLLFDATDKSAKANVLPVHVLNWQGRIITEDGSSVWVDLTPRALSKETTSLNYKIGADLNISGKVRSIYTNNQALSKRKKYSKSTEDIIKGLEKDKGEIVVSNFNLKNKSDVYKPLASEYEFELSNAIDEIGGKLYFSPLSFLRLEENPFKAENRLYPIDFIYPISDKHIVNIMLPDGYEVESLPANGKIEFNTEEGSFTFIGRENGKMLQFTMTFNLNRTLISSVDYKNFKEFYKLMIDKQGEKIVLKKIEK